MLQRTGRPVAGKYCQPDQHLLRAKPNDTHGRRQRKFVDQISSCDEHTETDRQADRQTSRQTDKQTDRQADRQTSRQTDKQTDRRKERVEREKKNKEKRKERWRPTCLHEDTQTDTHTHTNLCARALSNPHMTAGQCKTGSTTLFGGQKIHRHSNRRAFQFRSACCVFAVAMCTLLSRRINILLFAVPRRALEVADHIALSQLCPSAVKQMHAPFRIGRKCNSKAGSPMEVRSVRHERRVLRVHLMRPGLGR